MMSRICLTVNEQGETMLKRELEKPGDGVIGALSFEKNATYHFALGHDECLIRMRNNESDIGLDSLPLSNMIDGIILSTPIFPTKISVTTGYKLNMNEIRPHESATVMANLGLMSPTVHLSVLGLVFLAICVVFTSILIQFNYQREIRRRRRSNSVHIKRVLKKLKKELALIYYGSSSKFRWISFLFFMLTLIMVTVFNCLYKTSQIIIPPRFFIKNYQMMLDDAQALPVFFSKEIADTFQFSPEESVKNKIWNKLIDSKADLKRHINTGMHYALELDIQRQVFEMMSANNTCLLMFDWTNLYSKVILCGISPEDELWKLIEFTDKVEKEELLSYQFSDHYSEKQSKNKLYRSALEGHLIVPAFLNQIEELKIILNDLSLSSKSHRYEQSRVCSDDFKPDPNLSVKPIGISYFASFFAACLIIFVIAYILNMLEKLSVKGRSNKSAPQSNRMNIWLKRRHSAE